MKVKLIYTLIITMLLSTMLSTGSYAQDTVIKSSLSENLIQTSRIATEEELQNVDLSKFTTHNVPVFLNSNGLNKKELYDFNFYQTSFRKLGVSFSRADFPYTSSQYAKFSRQILKECFAISEEEVGAEKSAL